jgi:iron complex outermembrane receptor protein
VLGIAVAGVSRVSIAQTAPQSTGSHVGLETVIVTVQKREESLQDVPMAISALAGSTIDNLQARDFADYAALV